MSTQHLLKIPILDPNVPLNFKIGSTTHLLKEYSWCGFKISQTSDTQEQWAFWESEYYKVWSLFWCLHIMIKKYDHILDHLSHKFDHWLLSYNFRIWFWYSVYDLGVNFLHWLYLAHNMILLKLEFTGLLLEPKRQFSSYISPHIFQDQ